MQIRIRRGSLASLLCAFAPVIVFAQPAAPKATPLSAVIYGGHSLKGDGLGPYVDGKFGNSIVARLSLNLILSTGVDMATNKPIPNAPTSERSIIFDLSHPVPGSGARALAMSRDHRGRLHVFWKHNHETETILLPTDIGPVGTSVDSDRVEMYVQVDGIQHVLQMGSWAMGEFSPRAPINGNGTTKAKLTRESEDSWRITAPADAIARLWDFSDPTKPLDKGLYYFDFDVKFSRAK